MDMRLVRLRLELFTAAQMLTGEDAAEFWRLIKEVWDTRVIAQAALTAAQAALGAGRECANPEQHRCVEYHALEDRLQAAAIEGETLEAEITDLRARLDAFAKVALSNAQEISRLTAGNAILLNERTAAEMAGDALESQRDALATALARYGRHESECQVGHAYSALDRAIRDLCTCGLDAARAGRA